MRTGHIVLELDKNVEGINRFENINPCFDSSVNEYLLKQNSLELDFLNNCQLASDKRTRLEKLTFDDIQESRYKTTMQLKKQKDELIAFLNSQLNRIDQENQPSKKVSSLFILIGKIIIDDNLDSERLVKYEQQAKSILAMHRETGWFGFFKLNWIRSPKSIVEFNKKFCI